MTDVTLISARCEKIRSFRLVTEACDAMQGEGQISSRSVDGHVRERFGDTRGWEFYAQRTQKELAKLLRQPNLPSEAREKAGDLFSWLGDNA